MNIKNKLVKRGLLAFSNVGRSLLISVFGLILNYILIHYYSDTVFNSYVYFISIFALLNSFTNWGGKFYNTKIISKNPKNSKILTSDLISSKLVLLLLVGTCILFLNFENKLKLALFIYLLLKSFVSIFDSLILFRKKSSFVFISEFFLFSLYLLVTFLFNNNFDTFTFIISFISFEFVKFLYYLTILRDEISFHFSLKKGINILFDSTYFFCVSLAGFIASKSDFYIVGALINNQIMSQYFIISSLSSLSMVIYASFINTFVTSFYRFNIIQFEKLRISMASFGIFFSILSAFLSFFVIRWFYEIPIGPEFGLLFFFNCFFFSLVQYEMYRFTKFEKQKEILISLLISGILNVVLSLFLIKHFQIFGAFLANTLGLLINYLFMKFYFIKEINREI